MSTRANYWKLGLFVVGCSALAIITLLWVGAQRLNRETQRFHCFFDETVQGLEIGAPAKMRGVTIGTVATIGFASDHRHVDVEVDFYLEVLERLGMWPLESDSDVWREDIRVKLGTIGITGTKYLEIDFVDGSAMPMAELPFPVPTRSLPTQPSTLKSIEEGVTALTDAMPQLVMTMEKVGARVAHVAEEIDFVAISRRTEQLLETMQDRVGALDVEGLQGEVRSLLSDADQTITSARSLLDSLDQDRGAVTGALDAWTQLAGTLGSTLEELDMPALGRVVEETAASYRGLAYEATSLAGELNSDLDSLRDALRSLQALVDYLERNPSSLLRGRTTPDQR